MNKTAIKNFAIQARNKLIADISYRAGLMGITTEGISEALPQSTPGTEEGRSLSAIPWKDAVNSVTKVRTPSCKIARYTANCKEVLNT